jgi:hypothetical protein
MTIFLTICSANYLAHAKTLGDSLVAHNRDARLVIGLVDRLPKDLSASTWQPHELLPVEELGITKLPDMVVKYNIIEFNTAVKPFYIEYLYSRSASVESVVYLDPDILVCASLQPLVEKLKLYPIVVTPHGCSYDDSPLNLHFETAMLAMGIYNLGFIGTSRHETTFSFLRWWQKRLETHCLYRPGSGIFVDQQWVTLAPLYFSGVSVEKDPGYNMAYWNHFERTLSVQDGVFFVNRTHRLRFYHFSSFNPRNPSLITKHGEGLIPRTFTERPDLRNIFSIYTKLLLANGYDQVRSIPYTLPTFYGKTKPSPRDSIKRIARKGLASLPRPVRRLCKRLADFSSSAFEAA